MFEMEISTKNSMVLDEGAGAAAAEVPGDGSADRQRSGQSILINTEEDDNRQERPVPEPCGLK